MLTTRSSCHTQVVDPENVAKHVKKERPVSKKTTFYCVRFFPQGD